MPRHGRHGGADPDQERPGRQRAGARQGARRQGARGDATATTAPGSRIPGLVPIAREVFDAHMPAPNQIDRQARRRRRHRGRPARRARRARSPRQGLRTTSASACSTSRRGCAGNGCVPLYNLMEDAATAEISRAQVWQWIRHPARRARRRPQGHRRAVPRSSRRGAATRIAPSWATRRYAAGKFELAGRSCSRRSPRADAVRRVPDAARLRRCSIEAFVTCHVDVTSHPDSSP